MKNDVFIKLSKISFVSLLFFSVIDIIGLSIPWVLFNGKILKLIFLPFIIVISITYQRLISKLIN